MQNIMYRLSKFWHKHLAPSLEYKTCKETSILFLFTFHASPFVSPSMEGILYLEAQQLNVHICFWMASYIFSFLWLHSIKIDIFGNRFGGLMGMIKLLLLHYWWSIGARAQAHACVHTHTHTLYLSRISGQGSRISYYKNCCLSGSQRKCQQAFEKSKFHIFFQGMRTSKETMAYGLLFFYWGCVE